MGSDTNLVLQIRNPTRRCMVFWHTRKTMISTLGHRKMRAYQTAILILLLGGCVHAEPAKQSEPDYAAITKRIRSRIIALQKKHPILKQIDTSPRPHTGDLHLEHAVNWRLDIPQQKASKRNARRPVYETNDAVWFHIHFYRGPYKGAAHHRPFRLGDLRVWLRYGCSKDASVIASITDVIKDEKKKFDEKYPGLSEKPDEWPGPNK